MGEKTAISWTDATINFWWGCTKVGPGCDHCYAEAFDKRVGGAHWGQGVPRRKIKSAVALLHRMDNAYADWAADVDCARAWARGQGQPMPHQAGRRRVFIQSMSDLFDLEAELDWFAEAWQCIEICNRLAIQIVTKRVSAVEKRLAAIGRTTWPQHAGLIITVVNQSEADRDVPRLLMLKSRLGIPWVGLSIEPMLGPIDLTNLDPTGTAKPAGAHGISALWREGAEIGLRPMLDWVIVGGESGSKARPMDLAWARSLIAQCRAAAVPVFMKQLGSATGFNLNDRKGGDWMEWAADLRVREFPGSAA